MKPEATALELGRTIIEVSAPIIELSEGILFLVPVAVIDTARAQEMIEGFLNPRNGTLSFLSSMQSSYYRHSRLSLTIKPMVKVRIKATSTRKNELSINP